MVSGIVTGRIDGEAASRPVFKSLVHREDYEMARSTQFSVIQQAGEIGERSGIVSAVPAQNFFDSRRIHIFCRPNAAEHKPAGSRRQIFIHISCL
jgi:hypothetical protein